MSVAQTATSASRGGSRRWLLLASLALNLFFIGIAISVLIRTPPPSSWDRNVFVRFERMAATLPPPDAEVLMSQITADRPAIEAAQTNYRTAQQTFRDALRAEPFDAEALRSAMAQSRAARQAYDEAIQNAIAATAAKMSTAGRQGVADWPPRRRSTSNKK